MIFPLTPSKPLSGATISLRLFDGYYYPFFQGISWIFAKLHADANGGLWIWPRVVFLDCQDWRKLCSRVGLFIFAEKWHCSTKPVQEIKDLRAGLTIVHHLVDVIVITLSILSRIDYQHYEWSEIIWVEMKSANHVIDSAGKYYTLHERSFFLHFFFPGEFLAGLVISLVIFLELLIAHSRGWLRQSLLFSFLYVVNSWCTKRQQNRHKKGVKGCEIKVALFRSVK